MTAVVPKKLEDQSRRSKPGNTDAGKAVRISRDSDAPSLAPSGETTVLDRLDRITERAKTHSGRGFLITSSRCSTTSCYGTPFADSNEANRPESMASR